MGSQYTSIPGYGGLNWKDPVLTVTALPSIGNEQGDVRTTIDTNITYQWTGDMWTVFFPGGGGGGPVTFNDTDSSTRIGGGGPGPYLKINADGSINVAGTTTVTGAVSLNMQPLVTHYGANTIASGGTGNLLSYTPTTGTTGYIQAIAVSGESIGTFTLYKNGVTFAVRRSYYGAGFDVLFDFTPSGAAGLVFSDTDVLLVTVTNNGPDLAQYNCNLQVIEV